jgi:hypothetical protein
VKTSSISAAALAIQSFLESMQQAGITSGTDKFSLHRYDQVYGRALAAFASAGPFAMLEIGFGQGNSIGFWHALFPEVFHYCLDLDHGDWTDARTCVLRVDQSRPGDLERAIAMVSHPISLIVDDGSHRPDHQLLSFSMLFQDLLQPGGLYIIEDIETSYWRRGYLYGNEFSHGLGERHSAVEAFKVVADLVNRRFLDPADLNWLYGSLLDVGIDPGAANLVETVAFGRNAILIHKRFDPPSDTEQPPYGYFEFSCRQPRSATQPPTAPAESA